MILVIELVSSPLLSLLTSRFLSLSLKKLTGVQLFCPVAGGFLLQVAAAAKVKQNSTGDAQLPVKTQKILDEKNDLILKMREEIQANNFCSI